MLRRLRTLAAATAAVLSACSHPPPLRTEGEPDWAHRTRTLENGKLIFVGSAGAVLQENARFKAEGAALEDLANECSLIPKSAHLESRYTVRGTYEFSVWAKISADLQECNDARQAVDPGQIRYYAHSDLTAQLKRYQDMNETGEMKPASSPVTVEPPAEMPPSLERDSHWDETLYYYGLRQSLAYQKQIAVLAPAEAYPPLSVAAQRFVKAVEPAAQLVLAMEKGNPVLVQKARAWSELADKPRVIRPEVLARHVRPAGVPVSRQAKKPPVKRGGPVQPPATTDLPRRRTGVTGG